MKLLILLTAFIVTISLAHLVLAPTTQDLYYENAIKEVNISYDSLNRISSKNTSTQNISYFYDEQYQGTLTNVSFSNSSYKYEYDDKLRLTKETKVIDGVTFQRNVYYDSSGRLVKQTFSPGQDINYTHNDQGKIENISGFISDASYNPFDNLLNRTYANYLISYISYDNRSRATQIKTDPYQELNYTYDKVGNILTINDSVNGKLYNMTYDYLDRLVNTSIASIAYIYSYDAIGRMLKIVRDNNNTTKFVYDSYPVHAPSRTVTGVAGIDVHKENVLYSDNKTRALEFYLANEINTYLDGANWSVEFVNSSKINSTMLVGIDTNESVLVIVGFNYTDAGRYEINVTGQYFTSIDYENTTNRFGVTIDSLSVKSANISNVTFEYVIKNDMNLTTQNISWACDSGNSSASPFTLSGKQQRIENFSFNYSSPGDKSITCDTTSADGNDSKTLEFDLKGIEIEDYNSTALSENSRTVNFTIKNYWHPVAVTWYITSDNQTFTNNTSTLSTNGTASVSQTINYTTDGSKTIFVNISAGSIADKFNDSFALKALKIENYNNLNITPTRRITEFEIENRWGENQSVNWNTTNPTITSNVTTNLTSGEFVFVIIENNYSNQGANKPKITVYNNTFVDTFLSRFIVKPLQI